MRTRKLGNSDLELSAVGFGAWAIGGGDWTFGWGPQDDEQSVAAIHRALDLGVNWIDTAAVYGLGHSEEVVARALAGRPEVVVATKCGLRWRGKKLYNDLSRAGIVEEVEQSLRRLRRETIDLYQIHWPMPDGEVEEGWSALAELRRQGKIRHAGVSNFSVEQLQRAQQIAPVESLQPPYSMLDRRIEGAQLPFCAEHVIGVIAYSPMQCGLLTGAFDRERLASLPRRDWRRHNALFKEPLVTRVLELVARLRPIATDAGQTLAQLALCWVLRRPEVTAAIVGARRPAQIEETAAAGELSLTSEQVQRIEDVLQEVDVAAP